METNELDPIVKGFGVIAILTVLYLLAQIIRWAVR